MINKSDLAFLAVRILALYYLGMAIISAAPLYSLLLRGGQNASPLLFLTVPVSVVVFAVIWILAEPLSRWLFYTGKPTRLPEADPVTADSLGAVALMVIGIFLVMTGFPRFIGSVISLTLEKPAEYNWGPYKTQFIGTLFESALKVISGSILITASGPILAFTRRFQKSRESDDAL